MSRDANKGINVAYNYMNLPTQITFDAGGKIEYTYSSVGAKLRMQEYDNSGALSKTKDYLGGFVYEDNQLEFVQTAEGRAVPNGASFDYEYYLKDHLGNTRVAFNEAGEVSQETHYYPFGLRLKGGAWQQSGASRNKYLYNGKELEGEGLGLNWFDYGARRYDPQLGKWHSVDPVDEFHSPYVYVGNIPTVFIDPNGMFREFADDFTGPLGSGDWYISDRLNATQRWREANAYNLDQLLFAEYQTISQRTALYQWFDGWRKKAGHEILWPAAAAIVAGQMAEVENPVAAFWIGDEVVNFANAGNEAIFNDVFDDLREVYKSGTLLIGTAAKKWDAETLYREQFIVVQPLYSGQSTETIQTLQKMASGSGIYRFFVPDALKFEGDIANPHDRYDHGMIKVVKFYLTKPAQ